MRDDIEILSIEDDETDETGQSVILTLDVDRARWAVMDDAEKIDVIARASRIAADRIMRRRINA